MMIKLLTFPPAFGLFAASPFCVKAAYLLNMSGQKWEREDILDPRKMPYGKLPAIRAGDRLIADSDRIQAYLESEGADFNKGLSDLDKANARAFIRMSEEHLYFHLVLDRWADDAIWPKVRDVYFSQIPPGLRHVIAAGVRRKTLSGLHAQGLGRLSQEERLARIEPDIDAITVRLRHSKFLFGDQPTAADASVAPMLAAATASPGVTPMGRMISGNEVLMTYIAGVEESCG
ncbi:glutathione S-transferase [Roseobacter sp. OBYS 0001]|uniref:glutathione S-transferase family protein n=2 Tax=Roseobacter TaxID=2433 RepID=UPI001BC042F8|nr:glutathione S-transferase family protein [Roseobacter litoralis]GIT86516.1 glutathione S-transferase [Roseobacter sp. OBYS 0001]